MPLITVILPTRNPNPQRLRATLTALAAQTLRRDDWELIVVDNGSSSRVDPLIFCPGGLPSLKIVLETQVGLTAARLAGIRVARGEFVVFVDDDNVLSSTYLATVFEAFSGASQLGVAGGPITGEFETPPAPWIQEFLGLLALRELGTLPVFAEGGSNAPWPHCAPVGAGLCARRTALEPYLDALAKDPSRLALDRRGTSLASGGDNDLVFTALHAGWQVGYLPALALTHLIPSSRLEPAYLFRLNQGIMRTWVRVLDLHHQCPWPAIRPATVPLRAMRTAWRMRAWRSPAHRVRWAGTLGQFQGQADLSRRSRRPR